MEINGLRYYPTLSEKKFVETLITVLFFPRRVGRAVDCGLGSAEKNC